jgi:hypothetical protein
MANIPGDTYSVLQAGKDFAIKKNTVAVPVIGNRVDLVWDISVRSKKAITVLLDKQKPSAYTQSYYYTRPVLAGSGIYLGKMGKLLALQLGKAAEEEDWIMTIEAIDTLNMQMKFSLNGSKTGRDGTGSSDSLFTSRSGKIRIEPGQWFRRKSPGDFNMFSWIAPGDTIAWQVKLMGRDSVVPEPSAVVTVVQGVANTSHVLTLTGEGLAHLKEVRVYQPPLKEGKP